MERSNTFTRNGKAKMIELFKAISDQGNLMISKVITYFGISVGIGGGAVQAVANSNSSNEIIQQCAGMTPEWLAYMPGIAATSLVIQNISNVYFRRLEAKAKIKEAENESGE